MSANKETSNSSFNEKIRSDSSILNEYSSNFLSWHSKIAHKDTWGIVLELCKNISHSETTRRRIERFSHLSKEIESLSPRISLLSYTKDLLSLEDIKEHWNLWKDIHLEIGKDPILIDCWEIRNYPIRNTIDNSIPLKIKDCLEKYIRKEILFPLPIDYLENQFLVDEQLKKMSQKIESIIPQTWHIFENIGAKTEGVEIFSSLFIELISILTFPPSENEVSCSELKFASQSSLIIKIINSLNSWLKESDKLAIQIESTFLITSLQENIYRSGELLVQKVLQSFVRDSRIKVLPQSTTTTTTTTTPSQLDLVLVESDILISNSYRILDFSTFNKSNICGEYKSISPLQLYLLEYEVLHCNLEDEYLKMIWKKIYSPLKKESTIIEDSFYCIERVFERGKSLRNLQNQLFTSIESIIFKPWTIMMTNSNDNLSLYDLSISLLKGNPEMSTVFVKELIAWKEGWMDVISSKFLMKWKNDNYSFLNGWLTRIHNEFTLHQLQNEGENTIHLLDIISLLTFNNLPRGDIREYAKEVIGEEILRIISKALYNCRLKNLDEGEKLKKEVKEFLFHPNGGCQIASPLKEKIIHMLGILSSSTLEDAKMYLKSEHHDFKFTSSEITRLLSNRMDFKLVAAVAAAVVEGEEGKE